MKLNAYSWFVSGVAVCLLGSAVAKGSIILSVDSVTALAGSSGNAFDVRLSNTGQSAITLGGFTFGISTANLLIDFTRATTATTAPYVFGSNSTFGPNLAGPTSGQSLTVSDVFSTPLSGTLLASGATMGLGHILFDVSAAATAGVSAVNLAVFPLTSLADPDGANFAVDILSQGQITITGAPTAVPEPSLLVPLVAGLTLIVVRRKRLVVQ